MAAWRSGDAALIARVSAARGEALVALGREDEAQRACRDVIDWARSRHVAAEALPAVFCLAQLLWRRGRLAEAATELGGGPRRAASMHPTERGRRSIDMLLGLVALSRGDLIAAHDHIVVALRFRMTHGYHWGACEALTAMAVRCALGGEMTQAATLFGAAQAARAQLRSAHEAIGPMGRRHESAVRNTMGDAAFDTAYGEGAACRWPRQPGTRWPWTTPTSATPWSGSASTPTPPRTCPSKPSAAAPRSPLPRHAIGAPYSTRKANRVPLHSHV